jgi:uncharacterized membrane protein
MKEAIIIISLVIIAFLIMQSISPKEHFTELYFNSPEQLPKKMTIGEDYNFSFTIISHEKELKQYAYSIDSGLISEKNSFTLTPGENITIARSIMAKEEGEGNVTVRLDENEIHFFYYTFE